MCMKAQQDKWRSVGEMLLVWPAAECASHVTDEIHCDKFAKRMSSVYRVSIPLHSPSHFA